MKHKLLLVLTLFICFSALAQKEDMELWGSVKFSKKVSSKFRFELEEQVRWADSISTYKKNFTDVGIRYKLNKYHGFSTSIRIVDEAEEDKYMRFHLDQFSSINFGFAPLALKQRLRYQQAWNSIGEKDKTLFRAKWSLSMRNKHIDPYLAHEYYWDITTSNYLSKQRSTLGLSWNLSKDLKFKLFLRTQKELNIKKPDSLKIIGIGTHYKF